MTVSGCSPAKACGTTARNRFPSADTAKSNHDRPCNAKSGAGLPTSSFGVVRTAHRHEAAIGRNVEQLTTVVTPPRALLQVAACGYSGRHGCLAASRGKGRHVHFESARFVRGEGHGAAVRREAGIAASLKRDPNSADGVAGPESGNVKMFSVPRAVRSVKRRVCPSGDTSMGRRCCVPAGSSSSSTAVSRRFRARFNPTPRPTANRIDRLSGSHTGYASLAGSDVRRVSTPRPRSVVQRSHVPIPGVGPLEQRSSAVWRQAHIQIVTGMRQRFRLPSPCDRPRRVARRSRASDTQSFRCGMW